MAHVPIGSNASERSVFDLLQAHEAHEREVIQEYRKLEASVASPAFQFLFRLILADEERHHRTLCDIVEGFRAAELWTGAPPLPGMPAHPLPEKEGDHVRKATERFIAREKEDASELDRLAKEFSPLKHTTLWQLLVKLMRMDTEKHIAILRFVREHAR